MGLASMPTVVVEIGFNATPKTASGSITWTDVSSYVDNIEITRGRVDETRPFEAGNATVHLLNHDRRFDPSNTAGPYYGNLLPRRPIRIKATWNAVTYTVFRGWVSGFPVEFVNAGKESYVTLQCFDALGLLGLVRTTDNFYDTLVLSYSPSALWRMSDPDGSETVRDAVEPSTNLFAMYTGFDSERKRSTPSIIPQVLSPSVSNLAEDGLFLNNYSIWGKATCNYLAFWVQTLWRTGDDELDFDLYQIVGGDVVFHDLVISNRIFFRQYSPEVPSTNAISKSSVKINDGNPHFIVVSLEGAEPIIYVDGVRRTTRDVGYANYQPDYSWATQNQEVGITISSTASALCAIQHVALFDSMTEAEIKALYEVGIGYLRESSINRFNRLFALTDLSQITSSSTTIGTENDVAYYSVNAQNVLELLQQNALSDNGELYVKADGTLQFYGRDGVLGGKTTSTVATFADANIKFRGDLEIDLSAEQVRNLVVVEDSFGQQIQAVDPTSYNTYGESSEVISSVSADETTAASVAVRRVQLFKDAKTQISEFVVDPQVDTANWGTMLTLDLLDQIDLTITPTTGSAITAKMLVQQLRHEITPSRWAIGILGSKRMTGYFITDSSLTDGTDVVL
jgi:hypothetical protein